MLTGFSGESITREDAIDLAYLMVATGRHVHPAHWVDELRDEAEQRQLDAFGAC